MKIQNKQIEPLFKVLNYNMKFALARQRDKFLKELVENNDDFLKNQTKIKEALAKKGKDGNPVIEDNRYQFTDANEKKCVEELNVLANEEFEINVLEDRVIKDMIQNSTAEFALGETALIDELFNTKADKKEKEVKSKTDKVLNKKTKK
tara:strand:- start:1314 stop:1760 length:447 start_codon:yes stop_codon:yes gene_type:complete